MGLSECDPEHGGLLIGVELSLTVPIVNSLAFLFTVLGEWWVEGKVISRGMCLSVPALRALRANM